MHLLTPIQLSHADWLNTFVGNHFLSCVLGMAQGVFLMHGVRLKVDHEDVQRLQQVPLLQHVSQW